jgi:acetyl esterase/lipase
MRLRPVSRLVVAGFVLAWSVPAVVRAADWPGYSRQEDVVYGRKDGMALTMDVIKPTAKTNGAAVIWVVSGGYKSFHEAIQPAFVGEFLKRGYTVFAVVHGSQPRYTIPDAVADLNRSVRYIRYHAKDFGIDPNRIGITGGSAGGHLSVMQGVAGDLGNPKAKDPVDRTSSRVEAVACIFPPTDFLNYGKPGNVALGTGILKDFPAPFEFREYDVKKKCFVPITDEKRVLEIARQISPVNHVSKDDPPTLVIHGDADTLVPIQQAELLIGKLKEAGVPAELVVKHGAGHGWATLGFDMSTLADWFDKYIGKPADGSPQRN